MRARWFRPVASAWRSFWGQPLRDRVLAVCLLAAFEEPGLNPYRHGSGNLWAWAGAAMTLSLAWRLRRPRRVWAISAGAAAFLLVTRAGSDWGALSPLVVLPAPLIALYTLAARTGRHTGIAGLAVSLAAVAPGLVLRGGDHPEGIFTGLGMVVTAWALGESAWTRRVGVSALAARAAALEAERAERDRAAAAEERARIARELHDITAHHVSVVALQAGAARMLAESGRPPGADLLGGIETASRQAMSEIRQALGVIRSSGDGAAPPPGVGQLPGLTERMALAGLAVTIGGAAGPLPAAADLVVYRIVQEGLSNVLRHSQARAATVAFRRDGALSRGGSRAQRLGADGTDELEIVVTDDGPARPRGHAGAGEPAGQAPAPGGYGLAGLRERVARLGGELTAGPRPGGGFELRARLPVRDQPPETPVRLDPPVPAAGAEPL